MRINHRANIIYASQTIEVSRDFRNHGKRGLHSVLMIKANIIKDGERRQFAASIHNEKTIKELVDRIDTMDHGPRLEAIICQAANLKL